MEEKRERLKDCTAPIISPYTVPKINISPLVFRPQDMESLMPMVAYKGRKPMNKRLVAMTMTLAREGEQWREFCSHMLNL